MSLISKFETWGPRFVLLVNVLKNLAALIVLVVLILKMIGEAEIDCPPCSRILDVGSVLLSEVPVSSAYAAYTPVPDWVQIDFERDEPMLRIALFPDR